MKSSKDEEKGQKKVETVSRWEDVKVVLTMVFITLIAVIIVIVKSVILYQEVCKPKLHQPKISSEYSFQYDPSVSTFTPLAQQKHSKMKITGNGFIPCMG